MIAGIWGEGRAGDERELNFYFPYYIMPKMEKKIKN